MMGLMVADGTSITEQTATDSRDITVVNHDKSHTDAKVLEQAIQDKSNSFRKAVEGLQALAADCDDWSNNELAASHKRLYSILERCYSYYITMKTHNDSSVRLDMRDALKTFVAARSKVSIPDTANDMSRIVKAVFGADRRRVSAYSLSLRAALTAGPVNRDGKPTPVKVADLADWLTSQGGVEEVRLGSKNKGMTPEQRATAAQTALNKKVLDTCRFKSSALVMDTDDNDKMVVLVATYRPTGQFEINALIKKNAAVRAALVAHYNDNREQIDLEISNAGSNAKPRSAVARVLELA